MVGFRACNATTHTGQICGATRLRNAEVCFWHSPEHAEEAKEARRLGGLRRRREKTIEGAYDIEGLETVPQIRRLLQIATTDALGLEGSVARVRVLIALVVAAVKLPETGELEDRVACIEAVLGPKLDMGRRR